MVPCLPQSIEEHSSYDENFGLKGAPNENLTLKMVKSLTAPATDHNSFSYKNYTSYHIRSDQITSFIEEV